MELFKKIAGKITGRVYDAAKETQKNIAGEAYQELSQIDILKMVSLARRAFANNGFVRDIVAANDIYSVGDGIFADPATNDENWNLAAKEYFKKWSRNIATGTTLTLAEATSIVSRRIDVDGEVFIIKHLLDGTPRLQFLESQNIDLSQNDSETNTIQGISFNNWGEPTRYFFKNDSQNTIVDAQTVIHVFFKETFSSIHGIPQIQHALSSIGATNDIFKAVLANAKVQQGVAMILQSEQGKAFGAKDLLGEWQANSPDANAIIAQTVPGELLESFKKTDPNQDVLNALTLLDRRSCGGVLPPDFFDPSKIGGASTRLITSKAARHFGRRQTLLIDHFLKPVWAFVIANAMENGHLPENEEFLSVEWNCPKSITVDAGREWNADFQAVQAGLISETTFYAERGIDGKAEMQRALKDKAAREALAKSLNINQA